jgi:hypothetical protein
MIRKLRLVNPDPDTENFDVEVTLGWTYAELESVILSTVSRSTSMRKFRWLVYGEKKDDVSLVVTICRSLGLGDAIAVGDVAFDLRDYGQLVNSSRWGWRTA